MENYLRLSKAFKEEFFNPRSELFFSGKPDPYADDYLGFLGCLLNNENDALMTHLSWTRFSSLAENFNIDIDEIDIGRYYDDLEDGELPDPDNPFFRAMKAIQNLELAKNLKSIEEFL